MDRNKIKGEAKYDPKTEQLSTTGGRRPNFVDISVLLNSLEILIGFCIVYLKSILLFCDPNFDSLEMANSFFFSNYCKKRKLE